jgi:hypothetical protein
MTTPETGSPQPRGRRGRRVLVLVLWNLLFFAVGVEVLSVAAYFARKGTFYYSHRPRDKSVAALQESVEAYRIHPYFGFQIRPEPLRSPAASTYNNHGFDSPWDWPRERRPGEYLVGVFGGSVASKLTRYELDHGVMARAVAPAIGRSPDHVVFLNFAQGGFKQPQQVQILAYFLAIGQELDAVVNVDGFNEVALGARNQRGGVAASQPSIEHVAALQGVTPFGSDGRRAIMLATRDAYARYARTYNRAWSGDAPEMVFATGFVWNYLRYSHQLRRFLHLREQLLTRRTGDAGSVSWLYLQPSPYAVDGEIAWDAVLDVWENGAATFARLARAGGLPAVQVLQPNQYFPTARRFSDAEAAVALAEASPYRALVPPGYEGLTERAARLAVAPEPTTVHELFRLFDDLDAPAYEDDCCHYTDAGNERLAATIGRMLAAEIQRFETTDAGH